MKIISTRAIGPKTTRFIVEVDNDEKLMVFHPDNHYKLGYPVEDIVIGDIITQATPVRWCSLEQKWIE